MLHDRAVWGILLSNAIALFIFWLTGGKFLMLLWPYWIQSVVIGFFAWKRIRQLKRFNADGLKVDGKPVPINAEGARGTASSFAAVYFGFHFFHALALLMLTFTADAGGFIDVGEFRTHRFKVGLLTVLDSLWILFVGVSFYFSHRASHREHVAADLRGCPNIGTLSFLPFARIVPMHLTIIVGALLVQGTWMLLFGALKTGADLLMHRVEHASLQGRVRSA